MVTEGQLVNNADLPGEHKDPVKEALLHPGYSASRAVGKSLQSH